MSTTEKEKPKGLQMFEAEEGNKVKEAFARFEAEHGCKCVVKRFIADDGTVQAEVQLLKVVELTDEQIAGLNGGQAEDKEA